jgi:hypothetical protein
MPNFSANARSSLLLLGGAYLSDRHGEPKARAYAPSMAPPMYDIEVPSRHVRSLQNFLRRMPLALALAICFHLGTYYQRSEEHALVRQNERVSDDGSMRVAHYRMGAGIACLFSISMPGDGSSCYRHLYRAYDRAGNFCDELEAPGPFGASKDRFDTDPKGNATQPVLMHLLNVGDLRCLPRR